MLLKKVLLNLHMIDGMFKHIMEGGTGCAVILAGSDSDDKPKGDKPSHIEQIAKSLESFEIPYEVRICSAHKQPDKLMEMIKEYDIVGGSITYIAVAGGTDALSGTLSYHALGPVISSPPDAPNESCLRNPPGSSNAYIPNPKNVGRFIAQMYAGVNPKFRRALATSNINKINSLDQADKTIRTKYSEKQAK